MTRVTAIGRTLLFGFALSALFGSAESAQVGLGFSGVIDTSLFSNDVGINVGDLVSGSFSYDPGELTFRETQAFVHFYNLDQAGKTSKIFLELNGLDLSMPMMSVVPPTLEPPSLSVVDFDPNEDVNPFDWLGFQYGIVDPIDGSGIWTIGLVLVDSSATAFSDHTVPQTVNPGQFDVSTIFISEFGSQGQATAAITLVPEPSTLALLVIGGMSLLAVAHRWRKR